LHPGVQSKKKKRCERKPRHDEKKPQIETWIIVPDIHASVPGEHDADSLATVPDFMASRRFDGYLNLGDLIDFSIISSHNIGNLRGVEGTVSGPFRRRNRQKVIGVLWGASSPDCGLRKCHA
jgi:hypothetical protein